MKYFYPILISSFLIIVLNLSAMDNPTLSLNDLPDTAREAILHNLVSAKGSTEEARLFKAVENIRSLLFSNKFFARFNNDFSFNNFIITELAKRYTGNDRVKAAIALNTSGAGMWLHEEAEKDEGIRKLLITAFVDAAARGQIGVIRFLLKYVPEYKDVAQHQGFTPLKAAALNGRKEVVIELLKAGVPADHITLFLAAQKGNEEIVKILLAAGANPALPNNQGGTPLQVAAENGYEKIVDLLLKSPNAPQIINMANRQGETALILAANAGHAKVVQMLLSAGAQADLKINQGATALMAAAQNGHLDTVEKLLAHRADVNSVGIDGMTALLFAASQNHPKIVERLIRAGADINHKMNNGANAFLFVAQNGDIENVERLLRMKVNINQTDNNGNNALIAAVGLGQLAMVKKLIEAGINVTHKNNAGQTALDIARGAQIPNKDAIIKLLEEANSQK